MNNANKNLARDMRYKGLSYGEIARELGVSRGSARNWTRDILLTDEQKAAIFVRKYGQSAVDKRRITRSKNKGFRENLVISRAKGEITRINTGDLRLMGVAMYWSEGAKTCRNVVQFSDRDPQKIRLIMRFFREICLVSEHKFRGHISIDPHLDAEDAKLYWSGIARIPVEQFYKPYQSYLSSRQHIEKIPKYGTFAVIIADVKLFLKITSWIEKIKELSALSPIRQIIAE